ncbi:MAG: LysM peptidoglycan-binding domain-containing protein, partial [Actinomycetota bacterium]
MSPAIGRDRGAPLPIGRFLLSVAALLGVGVVIPLAALGAAQRRFGSWNPLAGVQAPWGWNVGAAVREPLDDGTVVDVLIRVSIIAALAASAVVVITTVVELVYLVRDGGLRRPGTPGLRWATAAGRYIAIGLLVVVPLASPRVAVAGAAPSVSHVIPDVASLRTTPSVASPEVANDSSTSHVVAHRPASEDGYRTDRPVEGRYVVQRGDSVWSIAERLTAGDSGPTMELAERILDANLGRTMADGRQFTNPALINIGWELFIPNDVGGHVPAPAVDAPPTQGGDANADRMSYSVERDDTLWDIAERHLGAGDGWVSIWELNAGREMNGGAVFDDPDVLIPGWVLELPAAASADGTVQDVTPPDHNDNVADPSAESTPPDDVQATEDDVTSPAPPTVAPTSPAQTAATPMSDPAASTSNSPTTASEQEAPHATAPPPATAGDHTSSVSPSDQIPESAAASGATAGQSGTSSTTSSAYGGGDNGSPQSDAASSQSTSPVQLEHAALLAAGILALVGVRRRARLRSAPPHSRLPNPGDAHAATERRLRLIDPGERLLRLDVAVRAVAAQLPSDEVRIGWIELGDKGDIRVQLTKPATLPSPWTGDGARWALDAAVPVELLAGDARQAGMPCSALVQIGVTADGAELLLDLEACQQLTVAGNSEHVQSIVAATATGLASSTYAEVANIIVVGLADTVTLQHRNAHRAADLAEAMQLARSLAPRLPDNRTTFGLRTRRTGGEAWEPTIVIVAATYDPAPADPPPGVAVVVSDTTERDEEKASSTPRLAMMERSWQLDAIGARCALTPIGVTEQDL